MSRTDGRYEMKTPNTDGFFNLTSKEFDNYGAGIATKTRNAKGDYRFSVGASQACIFAAPLSYLIFRTGQRPYPPQQFGTAASVAGPTSVANTGDPDSGPAPPPQTGIVNITPITGFFPKGIQLNSLEVKYNISGAALTAHTIGVSKTVFSNNAAIVVTDILANAANGLATATQAQPYVTLITLASPVMQVTDLADIWVEIDATTQGSGTYLLYGVTIDINFNFN